MFNRLKKYLPTEHYIKSHKSLRVISRFLNKDDLWHINQKSISRAVLIGLFMAFVPVPFQMLLAVIAGLALRANLIISVALVWISNPLTMGPMYYGCYLVGRFILGMHYTAGLRFDSLSAVLSEVNQIWQPLLVGCFTVGAICSLIGYILTNVFWRACHIKR